MSDSKKSLGESIEEVQVMRARLEKLEPGRAGEALRQSEELLRMAVNATQDAMISIGQDGLITVFNPAAERMFGRSRGEMLGQPLDCLMPEEYRESHAKHIRSFFATGKPDGAVGRTVELPGLRRDGGVFPMEISLSQGKVGDGQFVVAVARDISERKRTEQALQQSHDELESRVKERTAELSEAVASLRKKIVERERAERNSWEHQAELAHMARLSTVGEMASGIAHELNQPLCSILIYAQACLRMAATGKPDIKEMSTALEDTVTQAKRAGNIIRRVRHLVRKHEPQESVVDINGLIRAVVAFTEVELKELGITLRLRLTDRLSPVSADSIQIEQVILSLVRNSIEAMQNGETEKRVLTIRSALVADGKVEVGVDDTGPYIAPSVLEHVFDHFFTTRQQGVGLGLSISRSIIEAHGGHLAATSSSQGTTFQFVLPAIDAASQEIKPG